MKKILIMAFVFLIAICATQDANAQKSKKAAKGVPTWYMVKSGDFKQMIRVDMVQIIFAEAKAKSKTMKIILGKDVKELKMGPPVEVSSHGNADQPSETAYSVTTISTSRTNEFTATTATTVWESGKTETKTTRTDMSTGEQRTVTVTTSSGGDTTVVVDPDPDAE